jgi:hypothetical protein
MNFDQPREAIDIIQSLLGIHRDVTRMREPMCSHPKPPQQARYHADRRFHATSFLKSNETFVLPSFEVDSETRRGDGEGRAMATKGVQR